MNKNLDEYYEYETILNRMLDKIPDTLDKREGSIIYDALAPAAAEMAQMYIVLKNNIDLVFADTAVEEYLDRLSNQVGLTRKEATKAIKQGNFYDESENLMDIELNSRFTCNDCYWKIKEKISTGIYKLECETAGLTGNNITGLLVPVDYIQNLGKATLTDLLIPGEDEENDEELRKRYYEQIEEKSFGGNVIDYKNKTKDIDGVGAVKVTPIWNGGGTVKLTILDSNFDKATSTLIETVQTEICPGFSEEGLGLAPIGHVVTVDTVTEISIEVKTEITIETTTTKDKVKENIKKSISEYLLGLRKLWEDTDTTVVRKAQIEALILNTEGVIDVTKTLINNQNGNVLLSKYQIPILGEVIVE